MGSAAFFVIFLLFIVATAGLTVACLAYKQAHKDAAAVKITRKSLGLGQVATADLVGLEAGGTGANNVTDARKNLGIVDSVVRTTRTMAVNGDATLEVGAETDLVVLSLVGDNTVLLPANAPVDYTVTIVTLATSSVTLQRSDANATVTGKYVLSNVLTDISANTFVQAAGHLTTLVLHDGKRWETTQAQ